MAGLTGKTLGKYQVYERIGRGGMADVYRGRHVRLDRDVAIKVLHSHLAEGEDFMARFEREARAIASLQHPHIVQVYDFDILDDFVYMVMEFIPGGNLKLRLERAFKDRQFLELDFVQQIVDQVGSGLDYAHTQGMLHRDVKPGNILLRDDSQAVLADFGIARILSATQFTATGGLIGTPAYMSPEQGRGETLTPASDLYSMGVIVYEMLTNNVPFEAETPLATIHQQVYDPLPAMTAFRTDLSPALIQVVERALQKEPGGRYSSAEEFRTLLGEAMGAAGAPDGSQGDELAPAVVLEEAQDPELLKETFVMDEEELVETVVIEEEPAPKAEPEKAAAAIPKEPKTPEVGRRVSQPAQDSVPAWRRYWPVALAGLALVVLIVIGISSGWFSGGGADCGDIGQCIGLSENAIRAGDFEDAIALLDAAVGQVSPDEEPAFADLWCRQGDLYLELGRHDEAVRSFETCAGWTHDLPEMEDLRMEALRRVDEILGGG